MPWDCTLYDSSSCGPLDKTIAGPQVEILLGAPGMRKTTSGLSSSINLAGIRLKGSDTGVRRQRNHTVARSLSGLVPRNESRAGDIQVSRCR